MALLINLNQFIKLDFDSLTNLVHSQYQNTDENFLQAIEKNTTLKHLSIPPLPHDQTILFTQAVSRNSSLSSLSLVIPELEGDTVAQAIAKNIMSNDNINQLAINMEYRTHQPENVLLTLANGLSNNTSLTELHLHHVTHISTKVAIALVDATNQRGRPIKLAIGWPSTFSSQVENIFLKSLYITEIETYGIYMSEKLRLHFKTNLERLDRQNYMKFPTGSLGLFNASDKTYAMIEAKDKLNEIPTNINGLNSKL